ncbi:hypothetical protein PW035_27175 [Nonomuraea angiospora]|nr:hypothetical protein [Nonomuraea angiospora]
MARHDVRESVSGTKTFQVPEVGDIVLDWDTYPLPGNPGPVMPVFTAEPGSAGAGRPRLLASLHATRRTGRRASASLGDAVLGVRGSDPGVAQVHDHAL